MRWRVSASRNLWHMGICVRLGSLVTHIFILDLLEDVCKGPHRTEWWNGHHARACVGSLGCDCHHTRAYVASRRWNCHHNRTCVPSLRWNCHHNRACVPSLRWKCHHNHACVPSLRWTTKGSTKLTFIPVLCHPKHLSFTHINASVLVLASLFALVDNTIRTAWQQGSDHQWQHMTYDTI